MDSAQDLAAVRKPGKEQQLILEACGTLLAGERELQPSVPSLAPGSVYRSTLSLLHQDSANVIESLKKLQACEISNRMEDDLMHIIERDDYPGSRVDSPLLGEIWTHVEQVNQRLQKRTLVENSQYSQFSLFMYPIEHQLLTRANPRSSFLVAIDGSRSSHCAFHTGAALRRFGTTHAYFIDEAECVGTKSNTPEFIQQEYRNYQEALGIPENKVVFHTSADVLSEKSSIASRVMNKSAQVAADFIVIGASGRSMPSMAQVSDDVHEMLRVMTIPMILASTTKMVFSRKRDRENIIIPSSSFQWMILLHEDALHYSSNHPSCLDNLLKVVHPQDHVTVMVLSSKGQERPESSLDDYELRLNQAQVRVSSFVHEEVI